MFFLFVNGIFNRRDMNMINLLQNSKFKDEKYFFSTAKKMFEEKKFLKSLRPWQMVGVGGVSLNKQSFF